VIRLFARPVDGLCRSRHRLFTYTGHKIIIYYIIINRPHHHNRRRIIKPSRDPLRPHPSRGAELASVQVDNHGRELQTDTSDEFPQTNEREI